MKRLLLDTHVALWWLTDDRKLHANARRLIAANDCSVSVASLIELRMKGAAGKLPRDTSERVRAALAENQFRILPLTADHVAESARFEAAHPDMIDRLIVAVAAAERMELLTRDAALLELARTAKLKFVVEI